MTLARKDEAKSLAQEEQLETLSAMIPADSSPDQNPNRNLLEQIDARQ